MLRTHLILLAACVAASACENSNTANTRSFGRGHAKSAAPAPAKPVVRSEPKKPEIKPAIALDWGSLVSEKIDNKLKDEKLREICGANYNKPYIGEGYFEAYVCMNVEHAYSDVSASGKYDVLQDRGCGAYSCRQYRFFNHTMIGWSSY